MHKSLIDGLYAEALLLADEARSWFDRARGDGRWDVADIMIAEAGHSRGGRAQGGSDGDELFAWSGRLDASLRISLSCESLRLTTRLMHVIAWLLMQRAILAGELPPQAMRAEHNRLGPSPECDAPTVQDLPASAQRLIETSLRLHQRVQQLESAMLEPAARAEHPVHQLLGRLGGAW